MLTLAVSLKKMANARLSGYAVIPEEESPVSGASSTLNWSEQHQQKYSLFR